MQLDTLTKVPGSTTLVTLAIIKDNIFIGQPTEVTNQPSTIVQGNRVFPYSELGALGYKLPE